MCMCRSESSKCPDCSTVRIVISCRSTLGRRFLRASAGLRASTCCSTARARARPAPCVSSAVSMDAARNTLTVAMTISVGPGRSAHRFRVQPRHVYTSGRETWARLSNNYLDFLAAPTSAPWSLVDLRPQPLTMLRSQFGGHNSRIAYGELRQAQSAASMFSTSIRRDLGGLRRIATAFQPLVYIARQGAVCIYFSSTHRVCAARGDGLPLESMSARMEAM